MVFAIPPHADIGKKLSQEWGDSNKTVPLIQSWRGWSAEHWSGRQRHLQEWVLAKKRSISADQTQLSGPGELTCIRLSIIPDSFWCQDKIVCLLLLTNFSAKVTWNFQRHEAIRETPGGCVSCFTLCGRCSCDSDWLWGAEFNDLFGWKSSTHLYKVINSTSWDIWG